MAMVHSAQVPEELARQVVPAGPACSAQVAWRLRAVLRKQARHPAVLTAQAWVIPVNAPKLKAVLVGPAVRG